MKLTFSDKELIYLLRADEKSRSSALHHIYKVNRGIVSIIVHYLKKAMPLAMAKEEAEGIYHLAIIILTEKILDRQIEINNSIQAYLKGIAINLSKQQIDKIVKKSTEDIAVVDAFVTEDLPLTSILVNKDWENCMQEALGLLKENCQTILRLRMLRYSFKEIVQQTHYKDDVTVRVTHARCLNALAKAIEQNPSLKKQLKELLEH